MIDELVNKNMNRIHPVVKMLARHAHIHTYIHTYIQTDRQVDNIPKSPFLVFRGAANM
jgi:hypothetical protein